MIMEEELKRRIFFTNKVNKKEVKSLIACKNMFNLENKLKAVKQKIDLY